MISIIIPVYHEVEEIGACLAHLRALPSPVPVEILVSDGAGGDTLAAFASDETVVSLVSEPGRGWQMNRAARRAAGQVLLFLHVDTRLPQDALLTAWRTVGPGARGVVAAFDLALAPPPSTMRMVGAFGRWRSRITGLPYGDQAHTFRAEFFHRLGGYAELPLMEDVEIMERVRRAGRRVHFLTPPALTSARRYRQRGALRGVVGNWWRMTRYHAGGSVARLGAAYRPQHDGPRRSALFESCTYLLFLRDPAPGHGKTRLAAGIGVAGAAAVYQRLLERIATWLPQLPCTVVPYVDRVPTAPLPFPVQRVQVGSSLADRMAAAFRDCFAAGDERVVLTGSDIPDLAPHHITDALLDLYTADAVVARARPRGYYLIGLTRKAALRFGAVACAFAPSVLSHADPGLATVAALRAAGCVVREAEQLHDLDTPADLPKDLWAIVDRTNQTTVP